MNGFVKIGTRAALMVVVPALLLSGCGWHLFNKKSEYEGVELTKPLAIPPDLSKPNDREALKIPPKSAVGINAVSMEIVRSINVNADVATTWKRVGSALGQIEGVEILSAVEGISSYEVSYGSETMLISVQSNAGKSRVVALGPDGAGNESAASGQLLARLKQKL
ncbi:hypothetical protein [Arenimonas sp. GDDSR-1]|uniref:hypothetical protein n=1 Tax=Arenimonas sp. GDDSR-1 TaxID=2950125 RepID=UPI0026079BAE|nr:hypothetical protein [Arenimonas sp. GDDSR-1]